MSEKEEPEAEGEEKKGIGEYHGKRNLVGERHGYAWAILPNKDIYIGNYYKGMRMGKGLYVFQNGCRYEGLWRKSVKYGFGKMVYPDGSRYEGEWKNDVLHGFGAYYYPNNDIYEGGWYKGQRHGLGTYVYSSLKITVMGNWIDGHQEGPAQVVYPGYRFHGSWTEGLPDGKGFFVFDSGCMQEGIYLKNLDEDMRGEGDNEEEEEEKAPVVKKAKAVWTPIRVIPYSVELLPPQPMPLPIQDSFASLSDDQIDSNIFLFEPYDYPDASYEEEEYDQRDYQNILPKDLELIAEEENGN